MVADTGAFWPAKSFAVMLIVTDGVLLFTPASQVKEQAVIVIVFEVSVPLEEAILEGRLFPLTPTHENVTGLLFWSIKSI